MAEQLLDLAQIGAHVEQVGGIAVAQPMGVDAVGQADRARAPAQHATHVAYAEPPPRPAARAQRGEERQLRSAPRFARSAVNSGSAAALPASRTSR